MSGIPKRKPVKARKDSKIFTKTAKKTKALNVIHVKRGGIRL